MLDFFLVLLCIVIWTTTYYLYFRYRIKDWFGNRFIKDPPPKPSSTEEPELSLPLRYDDLLKPKKKD